MFKGIPAPLKWMIIGFTIILGLAIGVLVMSQESDVQFEKRTQKLHQKY